MNRYFFALLLMTMLFQNCSFSQGPDVKTYAGGWEASIDPLTFSHQLSFIPQGEEEWRVKMKNSQSFYDQVLISTGKEGTIKFKLGESIQFSGVLSRDQAVISGYVQSPDHKFRIHLQRGPNGSYSGQWNSFYVSKIQPAKLYFEVYIGEGDSFEMYPVLPDNRYRGTYSTGFSQRGKDITFVDKRAGYRFSGTLEEDGILLDLFFAGAKATAKPLILTRTKGDWELGTTAKSKVEAPGVPTARDDGWETGKVVEVAKNLTHLDRMVDSSEAHALTLLHSVLIAHKGNLVYENYFNGFHADIPQDQRSAAKSLGSAMVGIAIEDGLIKDVNDRLYDYVPEQYKSTVDPGKAKITLKHLLTMSSGLDVLSYKDSMGQAAEDYYQEQDNWLETVLRSPMIYEPGSRCHYGSANPFLLGVALSEVLDIPLAQYMHDRLFGPLGIEHYSIPIDRKQRPYFGGGTYLRPRDMLKFGEMYRNGGVWKGERIVAQSWVDASFTHYTNLENTRDNHPYGYQFWLHTYQVGDQEIKAFEARGAGGQYISIVPKLELVLVITSGNYRNGRGGQPEQIIEDYLLPAFLDE